MGAWYAAYVEPHYALADDIDATQAGKWTARRSNSRRCQTLASPPDVWRARASRVEKAHAEPSASSGLLESISFGDFTFDCAKDCSDTMCQIVGTRLSKGALHAVSMLRCASKITKM